MSRTALGEQLVSPLGSLTSGRLVFRRGASRIRIGVDGSMDDLYRAHFEGKVPHIQVDGGTVIVTYRLGLHPPRGEITLSGRIPWSIEGRMGMSDVSADLQGTDLTGLDISGGSSKVEMRLPRPKGSVPIRIGGGASRLELIRPASVPVSVHIGGGVSDLAIDGIEVRAAGGTTEWRSPNYEAVGDRYDIEVGAGASRITVRA